jgi:hypothetical protein
MSLGVGVEYNFRAKIKGKHLWVEKCFPVLSGLIPLDKCI